MVAAKRLTLQYCTTEGEKRRSEDKTSGCHLPCTRPIAPTFHQSFHASSARATITTARLSSLLPLSASYISHIFVPRLLWCPAELRVASL